MTRSLRRLSSSPAIATRVSPRHHAMRLAAAVPGARVEVLPGFGHMLHHDAADRIIAAVEELIGRA